MNTRLKIRGVLHRKYNVRHFSRPAEVYRYERDGSAGQNYFAILPYYHKDKFKGYLIAYDQKWIHNAIQKKLFPLLGTDKVTYPYSGFSLAPNKKIARRTIKKLGRINYAKDLRTERARIN